ncbi:MAG TPA: hypothetical protein PKH94_04530 [Bacteroidales bacterium]|nr:hypothetical protein [Bacteroidales bacterium]
MVRLSFVIVICLCFLQGSGQTETVPYRLTEAVGTGNTYGQVAVILVENPSPDTLRAELDPVVIPSKGKTQPYVIPFSTPILVPPFGRVPVTLYGYCLDPHLQAAVPEERLPDPSSWQWVRRPVTYPSGDITVEGPSDGPCLPGTTTPMTDRFSSLEKAAPYLVNYSSRLHHLSLNDLYLPPGIPGAEAVQQAIWLTVLPMILQTYTQEDAVAYWHRLARYDTVLITSPDYIAGTERIWQSALLLTQNYLCSVPLTETILSRPWDEPLLVVFSDRTIPVSSEDSPVTGPKEPHVPPLPPTPPVPPEKMQGCQPAVQMEPFPPLDGGLNPRSAGMFLLRHQQLLPLVAEGADADVILFSCEPDEDCPETPSFRREGLTSMVRYLWEQLDGPGHLTTAGSDTLRSSSDKAVLWCPPDLTGTLTARDTTVISRLRLTILDDLPGQPVDLPVVRDITIVTRRDTSLLMDSLRVTVQGAVFEFYQQPEPRFVEGECQAEPLNWEQDRDLMPPLVTEEVPLLRSRQRVILRALDQRDPDDLTLKCTSLCKSEALLMALEDEVIFEWRLIRKSKGYFLEGNDWQVTAAYGKEVIYEAPVMRGNERRQDVFIEVRAYNQPGYPFLYGRTPVLGKEDDLMARDTLHLQVDCNPNPNQAPALVIISWTDHFRDHDDPDHVETLRHASSTIPVTILPEACEPQVEPSLIGKIFEWDGFLINPKVQDHNPQQDDMWDGFTFGVRLGSTLFIVDFGIMVDQGFLTTPSDKEYDDFQKFIKKTLETIVRLSVVRGYLSLHTSEGNERDLWLQLTDLLMQMIIKGQFPTDNPLFEGILSHYMASQKIPLTREQALAKMYAEFIVNNKGWEQNEIVKKFDLGMVYSLWIIMSQPTACMQSCPVALDYYTWISLGDTDHHYKRTCSIQVTRWEHNQPHHHTYSFKNEEKGPDFD